MNDGKAAVAATREQEYDLIFMDCQMPGLDGFGATAEIRRRQGSARRVPIVAMTAYALSGDRERCLAAGMDDYLAKPIRRTDLAAMLERWLTSAPSQSSATDCLPAFNLESLQEHLGWSRAEDPTMFDEIVSLFISETDARLAKIRAALTAQDFSAAAQTCHTLRGSCGALGAERLAHLCSALEASLGETATIQARALLSEADQEFSRVRQVLAGAVS